MIPKKKYILLFVFGIVAVSAAFAQKYNQELDEFNPETIRKDKLGIRVGFCVTRLNSDQLVNTRLSRGYQGAFYYRANLFKNFHLNSEFGASICGSKFNNGDSGYTHISLLYFDLAVMGMIQLDANNDHNIIIGAQASRLMRSSMFIGAEQFPGFLQLPFKPMDYSVILGYHFNMEYIGFQACVKYGLRNIAGDFYNFSRTSVNTGMHFANIEPSLRNVTDIRNFSVNLSMYF